MRGRRAAGARRPQRAGAGQDALPLRPALDPRAAAGRHQRAGADGSACREFSRSTPRGSATCRSRRRARSAASACGRPTTASTTAFASRVTFRTSSWSRPRASRAPRCASSCTVEDLIWRAGRVAGVRYRDADGNEQRGRLDPGRRRRRSPLDDRRAGRLLDALPRLAQRSRARLPLSRRSAGRHDRRRDLLPVARGRLDRVRLPDDAGRQAADPADGPPRRGRRGAQGPRGLLAAQARRAPGPRAAGRRRAARIEAALDRQHAGLLPRLVRPGLGAGRRRRALQGPGHGTGHARRDVRRAHACRGGAAGARRPDRRRSRHPRLGGRPRPRVPARLPLRQRRHARRAAVADALRVGPRRRPHAASPISATCSVAPARRSRSRRCRG